ncbi:MAG: hypothetical protein GX802_06650 [Clostridiales bacterium]|nr:hypothetical protein [Clostridiales bacterium]
MKSALVKTICLCLIISMIAPLFSGCMNPDSISEFVYVLGIGVDMGEQFKYKFTFLMQSAAPSAETPRESETMIASAEGDNLYEAINVAEMGLPQRMNYSRSNIFIISKECAEKGAIADLFRVSWSTTKLRTSSIMVISSERADDFIQSLIAGESASYSKLQSMLVDYAKATGFIVTRSIFEFVCAIENRHSDAVVTLGAIDDSIQTPTDSGGGSGGGSGGSGGSGGGSGGGGGKEDSSPEPSSTPKDTTSGVKREGGTKAYFDGSALFDGVKMVGVITKEETQFLLLAQGGLPGARISLETDKGTNYVVRLGNASSPKVDVTIKEDRIDVVYNISIGVRLDMQVDKEQELEMRKKGGLLDELSQQIVAYCENGLNNLFNNVQELNCDAFGIGKYVSLKFFSTKEWEAFNYKDERYQNVFVTFNVEIDMEDVYVSSYID